MSGQRHAPAALYPRERAGTHCTGDWVGPEPVWTGGENLAPTGIRSPDHPARSQSLYQLAYGLECREIEKPRTHADNGITIPRSSSR